MKPIKAITSSIVVIPNENIDTDQIIPARFLKAIDKEGIGKNLFADWRYDSTGKPRPDFVLNQPQAQGAQILLAGDNFACGSSREHAVWALTGFGFRAVISTSFADIFKSNALKNGLLPIILDKQTHANLLGFISENPNAQLTVDLAAQSLTTPDGSVFEFPIDPFSKTCLLQGVDELGYLLAHQDAITAYETAHP